MGPAVRQYPRPMKRRTLIALGASSAASLLAPDLGGEPGREPDDYGLDELSRRIPARGPVQCPSIELTTYKGEHLRYAEPARIYVGFKERLLQFEKLVTEVAAEVIGRPPRRLRHLGTFNCRRINAYPSWVSEHGLGNAIDVEGFDFGPLPKGESLREGLPRALAHPFSVRVEAHWTSKHPLTATHAQILRTLAKRVIEREDIFRVLLGPGYPGHHNHFHFDCAPYRMVDGFDGV